MIPIIARIQRKAPPEIRLREMNKIIRDGLYETGVKWVSDCLPLHFEPSAVQRYQYHARSSKYLFVKNRATRVRLWRRGRKGGEWITAPQPKGPLCWTGTLRTSVLTKTPTAFNIKTTSTSTKHTLRVPVPLPHPMPASTTPELVRINQEEFKMLSKFLFDYVVNRLNSIEELVETTIAA